MNNKLIYFALFIGLISQTSFTADIPLFYQVLDPEEKKIIGEEIILKGLRRYEDLVKEGTAFDEAFQAVKFGCAYRSLTFNGRKIVSDSFQLLAHLIKRGQHIDDAFEIVRRELTEYNIENLYFPFSELLKLGHTNLNNLVREGAKNAHTIKQKEKYFSFYCSMARSGLLDLEGAEQFVFENFSIKPDSSVFLLRTLIENNCSIEKIALLARDLLEKNWAQISNHHNNGRCSLHIYWLYLALLKHDKKRFYHDAIKLLGLNNCSCCGAIRKLRELVSQIE